jgi:hypothetical protein
MEAKQQQEPARAASKNPCKKMGDSRIENFN